MPHATRDSIHDIWGERTPFSGEGQWPERVDVHVTEEPDRWVQSCCVLCTRGCGMDIGVKDGRIVGVRGRGVDRVNRGRLGPKGLHAWMANHSPDRLMRPLVREGGKPGGAFREASWNEAMNLIVQQCREIIDRYTSGALGFYTDEEQAEDGGPKGPGRAANELTITAWDPVSKQPQYKFAAVQVSKVGRKPLTEKISDLAGKAGHKMQETVDAVKSAAHVERSHGRTILSLIAPLNTSE